MPQTNDMARDGGARLTSDQIVANARRLADELIARPRAAEIDAARRLPADLVAALRSAGVFRMNMPAQWGGPEMTSMAQVQVIEALSRADASVGWCAFIWCDSGLYSGYLDDAVARVLYPSLDMAQSGWIYPAAAANKVAGGYRVSGRWIFGSGSDHCDMLAAGVTVLDDGKPVLDAEGRPVWRVLLAPRAQFRIEDTWHTTGLRGTGSNDYVAEDLFVPEMHSFSFFEPKRSGTLWARPDTLLRKMSGVPLGVGRFVIDSAIALLSDKTDRLTGARYRDMPDIQRAIGAAEAQLSAARAYVFAALEAQWQKLAHGEPLSRKERADTFLSRQLAFQTGRRVAQLMYDAIGGAAVYQKNPFDRPLRDMITACQHIVAQAKTLESPGGLLLGVEDRAARML
jgi:alkylation response protein AidB-like acyl-CoA dehydrogenase